MATPANPLAGLFKAPPDADEPVVSAAALVGGQVSTAWTDPAGQTTDQTLFQAASISKAVAALAALILVQDQRLALDQDVNDKLVSWKLPPARDVPEPVTVRHLLCHGGGISVASFPGYPRTTTDLPALRQILEGEPMTLNCPVRRKGKPGTRTRYSGGGYTVLQQLIEDVTRLPFAQVVTEKVFRPLGMTTAGYAEPPIAQAARGLVGGKEVPGGWRRYPELAAAGLWCTPSDLVRFAAGIQAAVAGEKSAILSGELARDMLSEQLKATSGERWGLGVALPGNGYFRHAGQNEGYISEFFATCDPGPAIAIMTASDHGNAAIHQVVPRICARLLPSQPAYQASGTPDDVPPSSGDQEALNRLYEGRYKVDGEDEIITVDVRGLRLTVTRPDRAADEFELTKKTEAVSPVRPDDIVFSFDSADSGEYVEFLTLTEYVRPGSNIVVTAEPIAAPPLAEK